MTKLYDEMVSRELRMQRLDGHEGVDVFHLHVRLFKLVAEDRRYAAACPEKWVVYLLVQDYTSYVGEPGPDRGPKHHTKRCMYGRGPDAVRIRQAIAVIDGFKAPEASD